jgi:hypothetical protein
VKLVLVCIMQACHKRFRLAFVNMIALACSENDGILHIAEIVLGGRLLRVVATNATHMVSDGMFRHVCNRAQCIGRVGVYDVRR